ncbi:MAG: hypothetical protein IT450_02025 [Phycisphaerales bacterium]|nr:hypothetical protein [Phycisphaerales bacterium]
MTRLFGGMLAFACSINLFVMYQQKRLHPRVQRVLLITSMIFAMVSAGVLIANGT